MYADDVKIYIAIVNHDDTTRLQAAINSVSNWSVANGLPLAPLKSHVLCIGSGFLEPAYYVNGLKIKCKGSP